MWTRSRSSWPGRWPGRSGEGLAEVYWAPSATWADLQDLLLDGEWHVLHFIGHGDFDPGRDEGVLALTREDGRADLVAAHRLVDLLRQARPMPRLVVLNSCSGAAAGVSDLFSGTAAALVRGGVSRRGRDAVRDLRPRGGGVRPRFLRRDRPRPRRR